MATNDDLIEALTDLLRSQGLTEDEISEEISLTINRASLTIALDEAEAGERIPLDQMWDGL